MGKIYIGTSNINRVIGDLLQGPSKTVQKVYLGMDQIWPSFTWDYTLTYSPVGSSGTFKFSILNPSAQEIWSDTTGVGTKTGSVPQNILDQIVAGNFYARWSVAGTFDELDLYINGVFISGKNNSSSTWSHTTIITNFQTKNETYLLQFPNNPV